MRQSVLVALCLLVPFVAVAQEPPAATAPAPAKVYRLPFSPAPEGTPDTKGWHPTEVESTVTNGHVQDSIARGTDRIIKWLIEGAICNATAATCPFLVHLQMLDSDPANPNSIVIVRFAIRGADGAVIEGYELAPTRNSSDFRLFRHTGGTWSELGEPNRSTDGMFINALSDLINLLAANGFLEA